MESTNELCADVRIRGLANARPRIGDGPRTVRSGANVYPWQGCDEWLLLSATRYEHAQFTTVRPVAPLPLG